MRSPIILPNPPKVDIEFTDELLTGYGGLSVAARLARRLGLPGMLGEAVRVKSRNRATGAHRMSRSCCA